MYENLTVEDILRLNIVYIEMVMDEDGNLYGTVISDVLAEFFSNDAGISGTARAIHVDNAIGGGHGPRLKIYPTTRHRSNTPCVSLYVDNGVVINDGNDPRDIKMKSKELELYKNICARNWDLMCYCYNHNISADSALLYDEQRRNNRKNPMVIIRDRNDGGFRYIAKTYDGPHGAPVIHRMVEFPGKEPIEEGI